jgi:hypothetical protein
MTATRRSRRRWLAGAGLVWLGLFGLALGLWYADEVGAFRDRYLKIRAPSGQITWVEFKGTRLRTAPSSDTLRQSKWVPAEEAEWERTAFPEVVLTKSGASQGELRARFALFGTECETDWVVAAAGPDGARWTYAMEDYLETASRADACADQTVPDLRRLSLAVETKPEKEGDALKLGVGLHVTGASDLDVTDIRKNGKSVLARIELRDKTGRTVLSQQQPLSELGFT